MKTLYFDMDGTIADLYGVENWLEDLRNCIARPYAIAEPLHEMDPLVNFLRQLSSQGWRIIILTWGPKESNPIFDKQVEEAKREWLRKYQFPFQDFYLIPYGVPKALYANHSKFDLSILIDDDPQVRTDWKIGPAINPAVSNIIETISLFS